MLSGSKIKLLRELVTDLTKEEVIWLSGYMTALAAPSIPQGGSGQAQPLLSKDVAQETEPSQSGVSVSDNPPVGGGGAKITITYGTESGNAKKLATTLAAKAKKKGIGAKVVGLDQYRLNDLPKEEWMFTIISTQGEGEPPATAKKFYDHLHETDISLGNLKYGVLALGDTSYPLFCKAGEDVDAQFQKLGATRIVPLQKLDIDYETEAESWFADLLQSLTTTETKAAPATIPPVKKGSKQYYTGSVVANINLNATGSAKETYHLEIAADGVRYEPGDALGVVPQNNAELVAKIIALSGLNVDAVTHYKGEEHSIVYLLQTKLSITHLSERVVKAYSEIVSQDIPSTRMDLLDLLRIYPANNVEQFAAIIHILDPITPRLYSIASSPSAHEGEVHLTVGKHAFNTAGLSKSGLCSEYLAGLTEGDALSFYIHKNHSFKLAPADKDIIMIGPGTGIAPFRSFVAERDAAGAEGRSWLFFGDQHFTTDFLYQTEWQSWLSTGALTKMNVAFSRDSEEKVYVQHKLLKHGTELFDWIESGAYVYVCGAKNPMSFDVENTLLQIIKEQKGSSEEEALNYLEGLKEAGRYLKDVY